MERMPIASLKPVANQVSLWRYMSAIKLFALFSTNRLYLSRADGFEDPFEGALGPTEERKNTISLFDSLAEQIAKRYAFPATPGEDAPAGGKQYTLTIPDEVLSLLHRTLKTPESVEKFVKSTATERFRSELSSSFKRNFQSTFISCWHASKHESEAMWKLYSKDTTEGVAIRTSAGKLRNSIKSVNDIALHRVIYDDNYIFEPGDHSLARFLVKRQAFRHESEVRLLVQDYKSGQMSKPGIQVELDLQMLIEEIRLSPFAPQWVGEAVDSVSTRFGIKTSVIKSTISKSAFHH